MTCCFQTSIKKTTIPPPTSTWPLRPSANGRYLVDAKGNPFFMLADAGQSVVGTVSEADAERYFANREAKGVKGQWIQVYNDRSSDGAPEINGSPFTPMTNLASPNEAYFSHLDRVLNLAKNHGIVAFLGVLGVNGYGRDTGFVNNSSTNFYNYGRFLGNRYKAQGNIIWQFGNDFRYSTNTANSKCLELARGISETDTNNHPMTMQPYPTPNVSSDAFGFGWGTYINVQSCYAYSPSYKTAKKGYQRAPAMPSLWFEGVYEVDNTGSTSDSCRHGYCGTARILRSEAYWSILWGCTTGYMFGSEALFALAPSDVAGWLNTTPQQQLIQISNIFKPRRWYDLIPDYNHLICTAGFGAFPAGSEGFPNPPGFDMVPVTATTIASTADGKLTILYMERPRAATIDMSRLDPAVTGKWINPENGAVTSAGGPFTGSHIFTPPTRAGTGGETADWILVLE